MATIQISLPRELAEEAATLGLLKSHVLAELLRDEIRRRTFSELFAQADPSLKLSEPLADEPQHPDRRSNRTPQMYRPPKSSF